MSRVGAMLAAVVIAAAGCTMAPDPFDYSGPVPNGSAPQNDFGARSNGILPRFRSRRPWPPVVKGKHPPTVPSPLGEESRPEVELTSGEAEPSDTPSPSHGSRRDE